jgi:hypothetical protein
VKFIQIGKECVDPKTRHKTGMATPKTVVPLIEPSSTNQGDDYVLFQEQIDNWRSKGFILCDGVIPEEVLTKTEPSLDNLVPVSQYLQIKPYL